MQDAPERIARAADRTDARRSPASIAPDTRAFVRALPRPPEAAAKAATPMVCTLERRPVWRGRLVLIDGCLRLREDGADAPGPLVLGRFELFRDAQGYLAAALAGGTARNEVRIGAPNVRFGGVGCSMDVPVPAPPKLVKGCGVGEMRRIGSMERRRRCSSADLARIAKCAQISPRSRAASRTNAPPASRGAALREAARRASHPRLLVSPYSDCLAE